MLYGLDCEMCEIQGNSRALVRVCLVDIQGTVVLDVRPQVPLQCNFAIMSQCLIDHAKTILAMCGANCRPCLSEDSTVHRSLSWTPCCTCRRRLMEYGHMQMMVKPKKAILDYRTRVTGLTSDSFQVRCKHCSYPISYLLASMLHLPCDIAGLL